MVDATAMRIVLVLVGVVLASSVFGCGSGPYCDRISKCSKEPSRTDAQKTACKADIDKAAACKTQYEAWLNCQADYEICKADGTSDPVASLAYATKPCAATKAQYDSCKSPDAGK